MSWPNILSWGSDTSNRTDYGRAHSYIHSFTGLMAIDPSLDWESTIPWLRKNTSLQIWLKGGM